MLKRLLKDESGAVATEYVVLTGLIAIALIAVIIVFRDRLAELFNEFVEYLGGSDEGTPDSPIPE